MWWCWCSTYNWFLSFPDKHDMFVSLYIFLFVWWFSWGSVFAILVRVIGMSEWGLPVVLQFVVVFLVFDRVCGLPVPLITVSLPINFVADANALFVMLPPLTLVVCLVCTLSFNFWTLFLHPCLSALPSSAVVSTRAQVGCPSTYRPSICFHRCERVTAWPSSHLVFLVCDREYVSTPVIVVFYIESTSIDWKLLCQCSPLLQLFCP